MLKIRRRTYMPFANAYLLWVEDYLQREKEFIDFIKYVPPSKNQKSVWSLKLANQLILIGSSIDSFFKQALPYYLNESINSKYANKWSNVQSINDELELFNRLKFSNNKNNNKKIKKLNMGDFRDLFEEYYNQLSKHAVYLLITREKIVPFKEWSSGGSLSWWNAYTDLKHNRFKNREQATVENVLNSLAALFLLNVYYHPNRKFLAEKGVFESINGLTFHSLLPILEKNRITRFTSAHRPIAKTKIFGYILDDDHYWNADIDDPWRILDRYNVYNLR